VAWSPVPMDLAEPLPTAAIAPAPPSPEDASSPATATHPAHASGRRVPGAFLRDGGAVRARPPVLLTGGLPGVPPLPGPDLLGQATIPHPPRLDAEDGDPARADHLADAYRRGVEAKFGGRCWAFRRGRIERSKHYATLVSAAALFVEHDIAPAAWVAWSIATWKRYHTADRPPPIGWMFGAKRIAERRGWFSAEAGDYSGGLVQKGPLARQLIADWFAMRRAIDKAGAWREPKALVAEFFPDDTWGERLAAARAETKKLAADLRRRAEAGEWFW
jgi:hypothetical protein